MNPSGIKKPGSFFDIIPGKGRRNSRFFSKPLLRVSAATLGILVISLLIPVTYTNWKLLANTNVVAPVTCTGDWSDAAALASQEGGTRGVAVASRIGQILFCSFADLKLEEPELVERATLRLTFKLVSHVEELPPPEEEVLEEESGEVQGAHEEIVPEETDASSVAPEEESQTLDETEEAPPQEESSETQPEEDGETEEAPEESQVPEDILSSLFLNFLSRHLAVARAQEEFASEVIELADPAQVPAPAEEVSEEASEPEASEEIEVSGPEKIPEAEESATSGELMSEPEVPAEEDATDEGEVLGTNDIVTENETAVAKLSYTRDGVLWTDAEAFEIEDGTLQFGISLTSTEEVNTLVFRLETEAFGGASEIRLEEVQLEIVRGGPEEPLEYTLLPEALIPEPRQYNGNYKLDPLATHSCAISPETLEASIEEAKFASIALNHGKGGGSEMLELGSMPYGIDIRFAANSAYRLKNVESYDEIEISAEALEGAQTGSLSVPIIYTKTTEQGESSVICQVTILNE